MDLAFPTSSNKSLTTLAFERLRTDILLGLLKPDERLRIQALSERYSIGPTAIREALSRLVTEGFVDSEDQRGFCVAPVSSDELIDVTQTRIDVESMALRHAIERGGIDWESGMLSSFHRLSKTPPPSSAELHANWAATHQQYHEALIAGCASPWTMRLCRLLYDKSERYRNLAEQYTSPKNRDPNTEHRQLMEAAMARDADQATKLLAAHFWETTEIILNVALAGSGEAKRTKRTTTRKAGA